MSKDKKIKGIFVLYVEDSETKLMKFKTHKDANSFIKFFQEQYKKDVMNGFWIDYKIEGTVTHYEGII